MPGCHTRVRAGMLRAGAGSGYFTATLNAGDAAQEDRALATILYLRRERWIGPAQRRSS